MEKSWGSLSKLQTPRTCGCVEWHVQAAEEGRCDCESAAPRGRRARQGHGSRMREASLQPPLKAGRKPQDLRERTERCPTGESNAVRLAFLGKELERAKVYGGRPVRGLLRYTVQERDDDLDTEKGSGHCGQ